MNQILVTANFLPNREIGMTLEAFAQAHDLPPRWLELRRACEELVRQDDFWYRPDLQQQASDLALQASNILDQRLSRSEGKIRRSLCVGKARSR